MGINTKLLLGANMIWREHIVEEKGGVTTYRPTDVIQIDGVKFIEVDKKPEVGDLIMLTDHGEELFRCIEVGPGYILELYSEKDDSIISTYSYDSSITYLEKY